MTIKRNTSKIKKALLLPGITLFLLGACNNPTHTDQKPEQGRGVSTNEKGATKNKIAMKGFKTNIEKETLENENFRKVIYSAENLQLVIMTLKVGEDIGEETHPVIDQFFRFESGNGKVTINDNEYTVAAGDAIIVPAGSKHNVINTDPEKALKLYTIYAPPNHEDGITRATKKEAETNGPKFDGKTTE